MLQAKPTVVKSALTGSGRADKTQIQKMIQQTINGTMKEAAAIHLNLLPLINALFIVSNPIPVKYALNHVGFHVGKPRLPLTEPDDKSKAIIEATLKDYHIDLPF